MVLGKLVIDEKEQTCLLAGLQTLESSLDDFADKFSKQIEVIKELRIKLVNMKFKY